MDGGNQMTPLGGGGGDGRGGGGEDGSAGTWGSASKALYNWGADQVPSPHHNFGDRDGGAGPVEIFAARLIPKNSFGTASPYDVRIAQLLYLLSPCAEAQRQRDRVFRFISTLTKKALGAQVLLVLY
jgi:hypothetical protein